MLTNCYCYILYDQALKKKLDSDISIKEENTVVENFFDPDTSVSQLTMNEGNHEAYKE